MVSGSTEPAGETTYPTSRRVTASSPMTLTTALSIPEYRAENRFDLTQLDPVASDL